MRYLAAPCRLARILIGKVYTATLFCNGQNLQRFQLVMYSYRIAVRTKNFLIQLTLFISIELVLVHKVGQ